jgi:hypothetical protein
LPRASANSGLGTGGLAGDYDNDGHEDLLVTYYGQNRLFHNTGRGRFDDVTEAAGLTQSRLLEYRRAVHRLRP